MLFRLVKNLFCTGSVGWPTLFQNLLTNNRREVRRLGTGGRCKWLCHSPAPSGSSSNSEALRFGREVRRLGTGGGVSGCVTRLRLPARRQTLKLSLLCCLVKKNPSGCRNDTFVVLVAKVCCRLLIGCSENFVVTRDRIRVVGSDDRPRVR